MAFSAIELTTILEDRLTNYYSGVDIDEIGTVLTIGDGIARVYGLRGIQAGEMCEFSKSVFSASGGGKDTSALFVLNIGRTYHLPPRQGPFQII